MVHAFKSSDGKYFDNEEDCLDYEKKIIEKRNQEQYTIRQLEQKYAGKCFIKEDGPNTEIFYVRNVNTCYLKGEEIHISTNQYRRFQGQHGFNYFRDAREINKDELKQILMSKMENMIDNFIMFYMTNDQILLAV